MSASVPPATVDPVQPMAEMASGRWRGASISASAVPRVQPVHKLHFSVWMFSRPMDFILAAPQSMALRASGLPVTRAPTSSLSSVRSWKAGESIVALPAILTRAGLVVSASALFGAKSSLAKVQFAATSIAARISNRFFIRALSGDFCLKHKRPLYHELRRGPEQVGFDQNCWFFWLVLGSKRGKRRRFTLARGDS